MFDLYEREGKKFKIGNREHHLLLCMEILEVKWIMLDKTEVMNYLKF